MFCSVRQRGVADLDLQIREEGGHPDTEISGGGDWSQKFFFSALRVSVWSKDNGGRAPRPPLLDPPLEREGGA